MKSLLIVLGCFYLLLSVVSAQNLENVGVKKTLKKGIKFTGGLGFKHSYYQATGIEERFNPNAYIINGNVTANVYGISIPMTFVYSNQKPRYNIKTPQPFNIVGISPTYKGYTLHLGYRNMTFSKYTLSGHTFYGVGAEVKKGKWYVGMMGGRMLKAVQYDSLTNTMPIHERRGYGLKVGYRNKGDEISIMSFYARDEKNSVSAYPSTLAVYPQENHVYSISFKKKINKLITLNFEGARSGLTLNTNDTSRIESGVAMNSIYGIQNTSSTVFSTAFNAGIDIKAGKGKLGAQVEKVDPNFSTLGTYYMNADFQNITVNASYPFWKKKLNLNGRIGVQEDDLSGEKMTKMKRVVSSLSGTVKFSKKLSANFGYSNFNSHLNVKPIDQAFAQNTSYDKADTMNYVQINKSMNAGINFKPLISTNVLHNIMINANYNVSSNEAPLSTIATSMYGSNAVYSVKLKKTGVGLGLNGNYNLNEYQLGKSTFAGVGFTASVPALKKKMKIAVSGRMTNNFENKVLTAKLYSLTNNYNYKLNKHHSLSFTLRYNARQTIAEAELSYYKETFDEFMANFGYNYRF